MTTVPENGSRPPALEIVGEWVLERASDPKFPFRLRIYARKRTDPVLSFFVQDRWPGGNQHIFCLREARIGDDVTIGAEVERVPVVALQRYGRRLSVVLDRPRQKRCDFQIVEKTYKNPAPDSPATYEQIYWFTQTAMRQRRPRGARLHTASPGLEAMSALPVTSAIPGVSARSSRSAVRFPLATMPSHSRAQFSQWSSGRPSTAS